MLSKLELDDGMNVPHYLGKVIEHQEATVWRGFGWGQGWGCEGGDGGVQLVVSGFGWGEILRRGGGGWWGIGKVRDGFTCAHVGNFSLSYTTIHDGRWGCMEVRCECKVGLSRWQRRELWGVAIS